MLKHFTIVYLIYYIISLLLSGALVGYLFYLQYSTWDVTGLWDLNSQGLFFFLHFFDCFDTTFDLNLSQLLSLLFWLQMEY